MKKRNLIIEVIICIAFGGTVALVVCALAGLLTVLLTGK